MTAYHTASVEGLKIFYREAGNTNAPTVRAYPGKNDFSPEIPTSNSLRSGHCGSIGSSP